MTGREILRMGEEVLTKAQVPEAKLNAWYLFSYCFGSVDESGHKHPMEKSEFFLRENESVSEKCRQEYEELLSRRSRRIPLEHLIHETEFMGLPFYVNEHVLIPRQDTECLVEEVLSVCEGKDVLDMCCGSGCIGISLAALGRCKSVTLADISEEALKVSEKNAFRNDVSVNILHSDLFSEITGTFDVIVSNPPYIPTKDIEELMPEVRDFEPRLALDGAEDGLLFYRSIIAESRRFLEKEGILSFEIGYNQGESVSALMEHAGFQNVVIKKDLAGQDRVVFGVLSQN